MRIALFDYRITPNNPIGGCHRRMLAGLCREHEFTVFAVQFDNPCPERIKYVHVPAIGRPLALLFITFHILAPLCYLWQKLIRRQKYDLVQMVESNLSFGDVCYSQFCHRKYLKSFRGQIAGKGFVYRLRVLDHWMHAKMEPWTYRKVKRIIVASEGLARELRSEYPFTDKKIILVSNPVELDKMLRPADFNASAVRKSQGLSDDDFVLTFIALGHFERKGLPQLLEAVAALKHPKLKILIVGGMEQAIAPYRERCKAMGLGDQVVFAGMQKDVRPFLWASDAFTLPSFYEVFPLVALEAAAAALPLLVTPMNGVEEFLINGENGILVEPTAVGIGDGLARLTSSSREDRLRIGNCAARSVQRYDLASFVRGWEKVYAN